MATRRLVHGERALAARIRRVRGSVRTTLKDKVPPLLLRRTKDRFNRQVDPNERPWQELADSTLERRRRGGNFRRKILHQTERLKRGIALIRGRAALAVNTGAEIRIGVKDAVAAAYGRYHQRGEGGQVQRRFLGIGRADVRAVDLLLKNAIIRANGLKVTR